MLNELQAKLQELSSMDIGDKLYVIRSGEKEWTGMGNDVERTPRMGLQRLDCLRIMLHVKTASIQEAAIPPKGLSLYLLTADGEAHIGQEGGWYLNNSTPAGSIANVDLRTERA